MRGYLSKMLTILALSCGTLLCCGCNGPNASSRLGYLPFMRHTSDEVEGIPLPSERIALLRKMRRKAAWAKPDEQARISGELAAAFRVEADPLIRIEMVRAISRYPTAAAASVLDAALHDPNPDVRLTACQAWGERGDDPKAVAKLSEVLESDLDADVRLTAAQALGETGDRVAIGALGTALEDRDPAMQYQAVQSLRKVTGEELGNDVNQWRRYVKGELPAPSKPLSIAERIRRLMIF